MADTLGVPDFSPALDINFGRTFADNLQSLGNQLREDMLAVQANRQVKNLGASLSQLDPRSDVFPTQLAQVAMANPLGVVHPAGKLAISTMGAAYKEWKRSVEEQKPTYSSGARGLIYDKRTGEVVREPDYPPVPERETPEQRKERELELIRERAKFRATGGGLSPTETGFMAQYARPAKGLAEVEPILRSAGLGLDSTWSESKSRWDKAIAEGKISREDALRANHWLTEFRRTTKAKPGEDVSGELANSLGKLSALERKAMPDVTRPAPTTAMEGELPSGDAIAGGLGLMGGTPEPKTAEEVRAAVRSGALTRDAAVQILRDKFGMQ